MIKFATNVMINRNDTKIEVAKTKNIMIKEKYIRSLLLILITCFLMNVTVKGEDLKRIVDLSGYWKFSIGDNNEWVDPDFDDSEWGKIYVPGNWEGQGYKDYNGYAWYRTSFEFIFSVANDYLFLKLGHIDDVDEVYLNGKLIGSSGKFPPLFETAYRNARVYPIPIECLNTKGKNTIAIRVYDQYEGGGIVHGEVGLFSDRQEQLLELNLAGYWNFETETELKERRSNGLEKKENKIFVPGAWENLGYEGYDGKARYTTTFSVSSHLLEKDLYLILGFIDDIETVYINGQKIGSVVSLEKKEKTGLPYYVIFRGYLIPDGVLKANDVNELSVVVYDHSGLGGIYKGPVGLTNVDGYETLKRLNTRKRNFWEYMFNTRYY